MATNGKKPTTKKPTKRKTGRPKAKDAKRTKAESAAMLNDYLGGMSFEQVAEKYGYANESGPRERITRLIDKQVSPSAEAYRKKCLAQYGALLSAVWPDATSGNRGAVETASGLVDKIARLAGADKLPPIIDPDDTDGPTKRAVHLDDGRAIYVDAGTSTTGITVHVDSTRSD